MAARTGAALPPQRDALTVGATPAGASAPAPDAPPGANPMLWVVAGVVGAVLIYVVATALVTGWRILRRRHQQRAGAAVAGAVTAGPSTPELRLRLRVTELAHYLVRQPDGSHVVAVAAPADGVPHRMRDPACAV